MRTRLLKILDDLTEMYFVVTQFEDIDIAVCKRIGISPGFKIVNQMRGKYVGTFAGYEFIPDTYEDLKNKTHTLDICGTTHAVGILVSAVEDLRHLPNEVNVSSIRHLYYRMGLLRRPLQGILDALQDHDKLVLRKYLYKSLSSTHLTVYDVEAGEVIYDTSATWEKHEILPIYFWLPVSEISREELAKIKVSPFKYTIIKPTLD